MKVREAGARSRAQGQTLVEVAVACVLMVVIFGAGLTISAESRDVWGHIYQDTSALQAAREALRIMTTDLANSNTAHVTIVAGEVDDCIQYQVPVGLSGTDIAWGAAGVEGQSIRVSVVGGQLVREVLDTSGQVVGAGRTLVNTVDPLHEGRPGFVASRDGAFCTIALRIRSQQNGHVWRQQVATGVLLRN
jgi:hypothetical protein